MIEEIPDPMATVAIPHMNAFALLMIQNIELDLTGVERGILTTRRKILENLAIPNASARLIPGITRGLRSLEAFLKSLKLKSEATDYRPQCSPPKQQAKRTGRLNAKPS